MESLTVGSFLDGLREQRGWTWREVCRRAQIANGTLAKIREQGSKGAQKAYITRVERAFGLKLGTIDALTQGRPLPEDAFDTEHEGDVELERGPSDNLSLGEVLYMEETDEGIKYRLEVAPGYGAIYIWPSEQKIGHVISKLRAMARVVKEVGGAIE